jgi:hypothetical protein
MKISSIKRLALICAILMALSMFAVSAFGQDETGVNPEQKINYGVDVDFVSHYVFRGIQMTEKSALQPDVWFAMGPVTLKVWGSMPLEEGPNEKRFTELRYSGSYAASWGKFGLTTTLTQFEYPDTSRPDTAEAQLTITYPYKNFVFFANNILDFQDMAGGYACEFGFLYNQKVAPKLVGDAAVLAVYTNNKYTEAITGVNDEGIFALAADIGLTYDLSCGYYIRPHVLLTTLSMSGVRDFAEFFGLDRDNVVFAVTVGKKF